MQLAELPPADPLRGWRIHSWILVLDGKREIGTPFFIEPLTGIAHSTASPLFLGIESIWNQFNYWVNMQNCSEGLGVRRCLSFFSIVLYEVLQ